MSGSAQSKVNILDPFFSYEFFLWIFLYAPKQINGEHYFVDALENLLRLKENGDDPTFMPSRINYKRM